MPALVLSRSRRRAHARPHSRPLAAAAAALLLLVLPGRRVPAQGAPDPRLAPGARVRVWAWPQLPPGPRVARVVALLADTLLLRPDSPSDSAGVPLALPLAAVEALDVRRRRTPVQGARHGAGWGGRAGAAAGLALGLAVAGCRGAECEGWHEYWKWLGHALGGTADGLAAGGFVGAVARGERWERVAVPGRGR
jgi:hypothetical protein